MAKCIINYIVIVARVKKFLCFGKKYYGVGLSNACAYSELKRHMPASELTKAKFYFDKKCIDERGKSRMVWSVRIPLSYDEMESVSKSWPNK